MATHYFDGTEVPHITERCPTEFIEQRKYEHSTYTHFCKLDKKHAKNHLCICGKSWSPLTSVG